MEVLSCGRAVDHGEVHLLSDFSLSHVFSGRVIITIRQLEESLDTGGGVFGASTVVAVRQKHHEAGLDVPLALTRGDELVDHDLSAVCKVTELSFPKDKSGGVSLGVSLLKAKYSVLGQVRVGGNETADAVFIGT